MRIRNSFDEIDAPLAAEVKVDNENAVNKEDEFLIRTAETIASLLFYLQLMSILLIEGFELGSWGVVFDWIQTLNFFTLSADLLNRADEMFAFFSLVYFLPIMCIILVRYTSSSKQREKPKFSPYKTLVVYIMIPLFFFVFSIFIVVYAIMRESVVDDILSFYCAILFMYALVAYLVILFKFNYLSRGSILLIFRIILLLSFTPLVIVFGASIANETELENLTAYGSIVVLYVFMFEFFLMKAVHNPPEKNDSSKLLKILNVSVCCCFPVEKIEFLQKSLPKEFRLNYWWFQPIILFERLILSFTHTAMDSQRQIIEDNEENEDYQEQQVEVLNLIEGIIVLLYFTLLTIVLLVMRPYATRHQNIIYIVPRISNTVLFCLILYLDRNDGQGNADIIASTILSINSIAMFIFWVYYIRPIKVIRYLWRQSETARNPLKTTKAQFEWHDKTSFKSVCKLILGRRTQRVSRVEWDILSLQQRFFVICAERTIEVDNDELNFDEEIYDFVNTDYFPSLGNYGFKSLVNVTTLSFAHAPLHRTDYKALVEGKPLNFLPNLKHLIWDHIALDTETELKVILDALSLEGVPFTLDELSFEHCSLVGACGIKVAGFLHSNPKVICLKLGHNFLGDLGANSILQSLETNTVLKVLHLNNNFISDTSLVISSETFKRNTTVVELNLVENAIQGEGLSSLLNETIVDNKVIEHFLIGSQYKPAVVTEIFTDSGELKVSLQEFDELHQKDDFTLTKTKRIQNELVVALASYPDIRFGTEFQFIYEVFEKDAMFYIDEPSGTISSFTTDLWFIIGRGLCGYLLTALKNLNETERAEVTKFINYVDQKGLSMLELVLTTGISHVRDTAQSLIDIGADIHQTSSLGIKMITIALEHEQPTVQAWATQFT